MKIQLFRLSLLMTLLVAAARGAAAENAEPPVTGKLPEPLGKISGGLNDLAQTGYFSVSTPVCAREKESAEEALIWTVKVAKPLSCRHALLLLDQVSDVRFYRTGKTWRRQLLTKDLRFSPWIETGTVTHDNLGVDLEFQVWLLLDRTEVHLLRLRQADVVEFRPARR